MYFKWLGEIQPNMSEMKFELKGPVFDPENVNRNMIKNYLQ